MTTRDAVGRFGLFGTIWRACLRVWFVCRARHFGKLAETRLLESERFKRLAAAYALKATDVWHNPRGSVE